MSYNPTHQPDFSDGVFVPRANFGAGCYWGTEKFFKKFVKSLPGVTFNGGNVGFTGPEGSKANPSYREVCGGNTGHVEVYDFEFTGDASTYEQLVRFFFQFHDPTTFNRQGNDRGTQYASVIYVYDKIQEEIAHKVKAELQGFLDAGKITSYEGKTVSTDIRRVTKFYPAEEDHQEYLDNNPGGYCNHRIRIKEWPQ